jgi:hypothetical protein
MTNNIGQIGKQVAGLLKEAKEKNESALTKANDLLAQRQTRQVLVFFRCSFLPLEIANQFRDAVRLRASVYRVIVAEELGHASRL